MRAKLSATMKFLLRIGLSVCLLAWLISKTNQDDLLEAILDLSFYAWAVAFLMYLASQVVSSIRWYFLAHALDFSGLWSTYLKYYFVGMYFNLFLPTSVGGDVLKMHFISRGESKKLRATYSLVADRLFGLAAIFLSFPGYRNRCRSVILGSRGMNDYNNCHDIDSQTSPCRDPKSYEAIRRQGGG